MPHSPYPNDVGSVFFNLCLSVQSQCLYWTALLCAFLTHKYVNFVREMNRGGNAFGLQ